MIRKTIAALVVIVPFLVTPAFALYGAIAYSTATGRYGYSYDYEYLGDAEADAIANCDASDAVILTWCRNEYCALAVDDNGGYGYSSGPTQAAAEAGALAYCDGPNARILCWDYSGD